MKKLLLIITILYSIDIYSGGPPCPVPSPCFCQQNPNHPKCTQVGVSIENGIGFLVLAGGLLAIYYYKFKK